jgi:drug/metabolite transporter (DMT)-like permease
MLLTTVVLWALNLTVSRYILTHGFAPLAYSTLRYGLAVAIFVALTLYAERTLRFDGRDWALAAGAATVLWLNQIGFVYALERASASTVGLILGATPIFTALIGLAVGVDRVGRRFWIAALVSFAGVALVAAGAGGEVSADTLGIVFALGTALTWGGYTVALAPLMHRYTPYRVSAVVLGFAWVAMAVSGASQAVRQDFALGWAVWLLLAFAVLGPLVVTNVLWFRVLHRIGPSRATLAANLNPFVAAVFALVLLDETMTAIQVAGGALIAAGILLARGRRAPAPGAD